MTGLHTVVHHLLQTNADTGFGPGEQGVLFNFMRKYLEGPHGMKAMKAFLHFKHKRANFSSPELFEKEVQEDAMTFWEFAEAYAPELSSLARRVFHTPATSVPTERSFSTMNLAHTKGRNRLSADKTSKVSFIHINRNATDEKKNGSETVSKQFVSELDEDEALDIEDHTTPVSGEDYEEQAEGSKRTFNDMVSGGDIDEGKRAKNEK